MKLHKWVAGLCALAGGLTMAAGIYLGLTAPNRQPVLLETVPDGQQLVSRFMEDVCRGDLSQASGLLLGQPELTIPEEPQTLQGYLWEQYYDALAYSLVGEVYATHQGLYQDVELEVPELSTVLEQINALTPEILMERIDSAENISQIYNEENEYRPELIESVLMEAGEKAWDGHTVTRRTIPMKLVYHDQAWWVEPSRELIAVLEGNMERE